MYSNAADQPPPRRPEQDPQAAATVLPSSAIDLPRTDATSLLTPVPDLSIPLDTKIQPPEIRPEWLDRPALLRRLSGTTARLILIGAPAGSGKTVVISQWRAVEDSSRFAWTTLDSGDNDPSRLWWKVISAVRRACPEFDVDPPQLVTPRQGR